MASAGEQAAADGEQGLGRLGRRVGRVRRRVTIRKSAVRSFRVTTRPAMLARAWPAPTRSHSGQSSSSRSASALQVVVEGGLGADALALLVGIDRPAVLAAGEPRRAEGRARRSARPGRLGRRGRGRPPSVAVPPQGRHERRRPRRAGSRPALAPGTLAPPPRRSRRIRAACRDPRRSWPGTCWAPGRWTTVIPITVGLRCRALQPGQGHGAGGAPCRRSGAGKVDPGLVQRQGLHQRRSRARAMPCP